jgi:hypothetical protein
MRLKTEYQTLIELTVTRVNANQKLTDNKREEATNEEEAA